VLLAAGELARNRKLFHGLFSTNQGMHQHQPGTVLSTGLFHHSGNRPHSGDKFSMSIPAPSVKVQQTQFVAEHERAFRSRPFS
jgi:hypothetical protein